MTTIIDGDLEGCGLSRPLPTLNQHRFTAPTERTPSRRSASNGHLFVTTIIDADLEGCGPLQPLPALDEHRFTTPTDRTPSNLLC